MKPLIRGKRGFISRKEANRLINCFEPKEKVVSEEITVEKESIVEVEIILEEEINFEEVLTGRRVVDLKSLANSLWCTSCNIPLSLKNVIDERRSGLACVFRVKCYVCKFAYEVSTANERHALRKRSSGGGGRSTFDVNYKVALGMLDAGMGPRQLNTLLSTMNIPSMPEQLLKRHERKIGPVVEAVAKESCNEMIKLEKSLTESMESHSPTQRSVIVHPSAQLQSSPTVTPTSKPVCSTAAVVSTTPSIPTVITHTSTQPQVQLRPLASTPTSTLFQTSTSNNKVLKRKCRSEDDEVVIKKTRLIGSYDMGWQCRGNGKSYNSKSGHGALMGHHSKKVLSYATRIKSCRTCTASSSKPHDCRANYEKSAKSMEADVAVSLVTANPLFEANNAELGVLIGDEDSSTMAGIRSVRPDVVKWSDINHIKKGLNNSLYKLQTKHKVLQTKVIKYLKRCFSYAVAQNKGTPSVLKEALMNIPDHVFGKHEQCKDWCTHKTDPLKKFTRLPRGESLSGPDLYADLCNLFRRFADNANKIAPCGSTQANESFNAVVACKAPKSKYYSGSESLDFRVACAVSQSNLGTGYVVPINKKLALSPGSHTLSYRTHLDHKREKDKERKKLLAFKKRRMKLAMQQSCTKTNQESREGVTYKSGMGLLPENNNLVQVIPLALIKAPESDEMQYVYFDVETSGVSTYSQVIQIAAVYEEESYNAYILPLSIPNKVTEITGLKKERKSLLLNGKIVKTVSRQDAWSGFINFLLEIQKKVVLVGHNIGFDLRFLLKETNECGLQGHAKLLVHAIIDTLKASKEAFPSRTSYKQEVIASDFNINVGIAHNAINDVRTLQVIAKDFLPATVLTKHTVSFEAYCNKKLQAGLTKANKASLQPLRDAGLSAQMVGKISSAGLNLNKIKSVYLTSTEDGIKLLFQEMVNGAPRVTNNKKALKLVLAYLQPQQVV